MRYQRAPFQFMEMDGFLKMGEELDERIVQRTSILDVIRREWEREGIMSPRENDAPPAANAPRHENPLEDEYETTSLFTDNN
jgi:hypothetical protein